MKVQEGIFRSIHFYLFALLAALLPLSVFGTTFIQILLLANWIFSGDYRMKWQRIRTNRAFLIYALFYGLHILGLAWSSDFSYGLHDLKAKLPLIIIPFLVVSCEQFTLRQVRHIIVFFTGGTLIGSAASVLALTGVLQVEINHYRDASLFIGHIRFALMVVLSVLYSLYFVFRRDPSIPRSLKWYFTFSAAWLMIFLVVLKSLSGIVIIMVVFLAIALLLVRLIPDRVIRFMVLVAVVSVPLFAIIYISSAVNRFYSFEEIDKKNLDTHTINGNPYEHQLYKKETENGHYVWMYVCPEELEQEWNRISDIDYNGKTTNGESLRFGLIRYLTSKGLRKDSVGVHRLDSLDVHAIENGIANYIYLERFSLYPRIYEAIWEFDRYRLGYSANDKSLVQRLYYLEAGLQIFREHMWTGVGTGDVRKAFGEYYSETDSPLRLERRRRAHNQYLTFGIAFGLPLGFVVLMTLVVPVLITGRGRSYMAMVFLVTMALSMLNEDTLENNAGVVLFGLFYGLLVFGPHWRWREKRELQQ